MLSLLREASPVESARALLGWRLCSREGLACELVELEAYHGADDLGSHACRGLNSRNAEMFGPPGRAYVYLSYGVHWLLNVACRPEGEGAAVLVRGARPLEGVDVMRVRRPKCRRDEDLLAGPGRLSAAFAFSKEDSGLDLFDSRSRLWLEPPLDPGLKEADWGPRIGLAPGRGDEAPWRCVWRDRRRWVSSPRPPIGGPEA